MMKLKKNIKLGKLNYYSLIILGLLFISPFVANAQKNKDKIDRTKKINDYSFDEKLENIANDTESEDVTYDTFLENIYDYFNNPININKADQIEFQNLGLLSLQQINSLLSYRRLVGGFSSLYELQAVPGISQSKAIELAPFFRIYAPEGGKLPPIGRLLFKGKHQLLLRYQQVLEEADGYKKDSLGNSTYLGNSSKLYLRYRYTKGTQISYGLTAEKDQGEEFFTGSQKQGFDFYSGHFYARNIGPFKHIAIGDFEIHFGQGLVAWNGLGSRKGSYVLDVVKQGYKVKQYTSVNESNFFRGAAVTLGQDQIQVTAFGSYKAVDANAIFNTPADSLEADIEEDGNVGSADIETISSLQATGFHRTDSEIADKHSIQQFHGGGNINYRNRFLSIGLNGIYTRLSESLLSTTNQVYSKFVFQGDRLWNASLDYKVLANKFTFFGELAYSSNGGYAFLNGMLADLDKRLQMVILHRDYSKDYQSLNANAFAESSNLARNEKGLYWGFVLSPLPKLSVNAYVDVYKFSWLSYLVDAPSSGTDYLAEINFEPKRRFNIYLRLKHEKKLRNATDNVTVSDYVLPILRSSARLNFSYSFNNGVRLQSRVEASRFDNSTSPVEIGYLVFQDISYTFPVFPLTLKSRFALFDTPSYNSRIFAYESDVLYAFSIPAYFDQGIRTYLFAKYEVNRRLSLWFRFAQTFKSDQQFQGSNNDQIEGRKKSEIKAMMRFKF